MAEGGRQLLLRVLEVVAKSLGSEVEATIGIGRGQLHIRVELQNI
jgi:hypothetical protein